MNFQHYSSSVTWSFRNQSKMLICCFKTFLIIINAENSSAASYFYRSHETFSEFFDEYEFQKNSI